MQDWPETAGQQVIGQESLPPRPIPACDGSYSQGREEPSWFSPAGPGRVMVLHAGSGDGWMDGWMETDRPTDRLTDRPTNPTALLPAPSTFSPGVPAVPAAPSLTLHHVKLS